jgi:hypothetical protein
MADRLQTQFDQLLSELRTKHYNEAADRIKNAANYCSSSSTEILLELRSAVLAFSRTPAARKSGQAKRAKEVVREIEKRIRSCGGFEFKDV